VPRPVSGSWTMGAMGRGTAAVSLTAPTGITATLIKK
jgi:hypothetical protein